MFRLMFALAALVFNMAFASEPSASDDPTADDRPEPPSDPPSDAKHSDKDLDHHKGVARKQGRESGEKAERERLAGIYGVEVDKLDDAIKEAAEARRKEQSDSERLQGDLEKANSTAAAEKEAREKAEASLRERDIQDALRTALDAEGYKGKVSHALGALDRSKIEEKDGAFDAAPAVQALKKDEFPGFEEDRPDNPDTPPQDRSRRQTGETAADIFEKRLSRRGRRAG